ncbi:hypothetical protein [Mycoplasmopsis bovirhinis]|uniref:Uncharacterized protein n=1 Tax=Mycoplasmopsis bovirhinis TaxID=29553 RepID=A0A449AEB9_9BACT|nr:hypothetical protein [Mycoplasmopsis bovirhinis]VEU63338.1 Uncharacterised protein [Mycoplasmopsis bovirhinis]
MPLIITSSFVNASVWDQRPYKTIFLILSISAVVFVKFFYVIQTIIQKSKYDTITGLNLAKINEWRKTNSKLDDKYLITIKQTQQLYRSLNVKSNKIFITEIKKPWYFFKVNHNYSKTGQEFFSTKEEFIYFVMLLPFDYIKINFKNINYKKLRNMQ